MCTCTFPKGDSCSQLCVCSAHTLYIWLPGSTLGVHILSGFLESLPDCHPVCWRKDAWLLALNLTRACGLLAHVRGLAVAP